MVKRKRNPRSKMIKTKKLKVQHMACSTIVLIVCLIGGAMPYSDDITQNYYVSDNESLEIDLTTKLLPHYPKYQVKSSSESSKKYINITPFEVNPKNYQKLILSEQLPNDKEPCIFKVINSQLLLVYITNISDFLSLEVYKADLKKEKSSYTLTKTVVKTNCFQQASNFQCGNLIQILDDSTFMLLCFPNEDRRLYLNVISSEGIVRKKFQVTDFTTNQNVHLERIPNQTTNLITLSIWMSKQSSTKIPPDTQKVKSSIEKVWVYSLNLDFSIESSSFFNFENLFHQSEIVANHFIILKKIYKDKQFDFYNGIQSEIINLKKDTKNQIRFSKAMIKRAVKGSIIGYFYRQDYQFVNFYSLYIEQQQSSRSDREKGLDKYLKMEVLSYSEQDNNIQTTSIISVPIKLGEGESLLGIDVENGALIPLQNEYFLIIFRMKIEIRGADNNSSQSQIERTQSFIYFPKTKKFIDPKIQLNRYSWDKYIKGMVRGSVFVYSKKPKSIKWNEGSGITDYGNIQLMEYRFEPIKLQIFKNLSHKSKSISSPISVETSLSVEGAQISSFNINLIPSNIDFSLQYDSTIMDKKVVLHSFESNLDGVPLSSEYYGPLIREKAISSFSEVIKTKKIQPFLSNDNINCFKQISNAINNDKFDYNSKFLKGKNCLDPLLRYSLFQLRTATVSYSKEQIKYSPQSGICMRKTNPSENPTVSCYLENSTYNLGHFLRNKLENEDEMVHQGSLRSVSNKRVRLLEEQQILVLTTTGRLLSSIQKSISFREVTYSGTVCKDFEILRPSDFESIMVCLDSLNIIRIFNLEDLSIPRSLTEIKLTRSIQISEFLEGGINAFSKNWRIFYSGEYLELRNYFIIFRMDSIREMPNLLVFQFSFEEKNEIKEILRMKVKPTQEECRCSSSRILSVEMVGRRLVMLLSKGVMENWVCIYDFVIKNGGLDPGFEFIRCVASPESIKLDLESGAINDSKMILVHENIEDKKVNFLDSSKLLLKVRDLRNNSNVVVIDPFAPSMTLFRSLVLPASSSIDFKIYDFYDLEESKKKKGIILYFNRAQSGDKKQNLMIFMTSSNPRLNINKYSQKSRNFRLENNTPTSNQNNLIYYSLSTSMCLTSDNKSKIFNCTEISILKIQKIDKNPDFVYNPSRTHPPPRSQKQNSKNINNGIIDKKIPLPEIKVETTHDKMMELYLNRNSSLSFSLTQLKLQEDIIGDILKMVVELDNRLDEGKIYMQQIYRISLKKLQLYNNSNRLCIGQLWTRTWQSKLKNGQIKVQPYNIKFTVFDDIGLFYSQSLQELFKYPFYNSINWSTSLLGNQVKIQKTDLEYYRNRISKVTYVDKVQILKDKYKNDFLMNNLKLDCTHLISHQNFLIKICSIEREYIAKIIDFETGLQSSRILKNIKTQKISKNSLELLNFGRSTILLLSYKENDNTQSSTYFFLERKGRGLKVIPLYNSQVESSGFIYGHKESDDLHPQTIFDEEGRVMSDLKKHKILVYTIVFEPSFGSIFQIFEINYWTFLNLEGDRFIKFYAGNTKERKGLFKIKNQLMHDFGTDDIWKKARENGRVHSLSRWKWANEKIQELMAEESDSIGSRCTYILQFWGEDSYLFFTQNEKFEESPYLKLSNPYKFNSVIYELEPVCFEWLCVIGSIFKGEMTLLRFYIFKGDLLMNMPTKFLRRKPDVDDFIENDYYFDWSKYDKENPKSQNFLGMINTKYTVYTSGVANLTKVLKSCTFDETTTKNEAGDQEELVLYCQTSLGEILEFTVDRYPNIILKDSSLNDNKAKINFFSTFGKRLETNVTIVHLYEYKNIKSLFFGILSVCIPSLLFLVLIATFNYFYNKAPSWNEIDEVWKHKKKIHSILQRKTQIKRDTVLALSVQELPESEEQERIIGDTSIHNSRINEDGENQEGGSENIGMEYLVLDDDEEGEVDEMYSGFSKIDAKMPEEVNKEEGSQEVEGEILVKGQSDYRLGEVKKNKKRNLISSKLLDIDEQDEEEFSVSRNILFESFTPKLEEDVAVEWSGGVLTKKSDFLDTQT